MEANNKEPEEIGWMALLAIGIVLINIAIFALAELLVLGAKF